MARAFDATNASAAGKRSAELRRRFTLAEVTEELGALTSVEDAQRRLEVLGRWCAAGILSGSQGGAAVRSVEAWLRANADAVDRERLKALANRIKELEAALAQARARPRGQA